MEPLLLASIHSIIFGIVFILIPCLMVSSIACFIIYYTAEYLFKMNMDFVKLIRYCTAAGAIAAIIFMVFGQFKNL